MLTESRESTRSQEVAYRQFSRQRYIELKKQLTHLRESQIVSRVTREWENMSQDQKNLYFSGKDHTMVMLNVEPLATPSKDAKGKLNVKTTGTKQEKIQEPNLDDIQVRGFDDSSSPVPMKAKKIAKKAQNSYISFFKYHFDKLTHEHRKWTAAQVSSVVRLLWKKYKQTKRPNLKKDRSLRMGKPMTGRKFFMTMKKRECIDLPQDRMKMWNKLPKESKMMYNLEANPMLKETKAEPRTMKTTMNFSAEGEKKNLSFLAGRMM